MAFEIYLTNKSQKQVVRAERDESKSFRDLACCSHGEVPVCDMQYKWMNAMDIRPGRDITKRESSMEPLITIAIYPQPGNISFPHMGLFMAHSRAFRISLTARSQRHVTSLRTARGTISRAAGNACNAGSPLGVGYMQVEPL